MKIGPAIESPNPIQRWLAQRIRLSTIVSLGILPVLGVAVATAVFVFGSISIWFPVLVAALALLIWPVSVIYALRHGPTAGLSPADAARVSIAYLPWFGASKEPGLDAREDPEATDE